MTQSIAISDRPSLLLFTTDQVCYHQWQDESITISKTLSALPVIWCDIAQHHAAWWNATKLNPQDSMQCHILVWNSIPINSMSCCHNILCCDNTKACSMKKQHSTEQHARVCALMMLCNDTLCHVMQYEKKQSTGQCVMMCADSILCHHIAWSQ